MKREKEPVIVYENKSDVVQIEDSQKYLANITLGLSDGEDFYLKIDFKNLNLEDFKLLTELGNLPRRLKFSSELIEKEKYNITHIVVTQYNGNSLLEMSWECLSDDPNLYNLIIN